MNFNSRFACFLLSSFFLIARPALAVKASHEVFLNGEKPDVGSKPSYPKVVDLEMARGGFEGFFIRLDQPATKAAEVRLKWKGEKKDYPKVDLKTYWVGSHTFSQSSFKNKASGEVVDILIPNSVIALKQATIPLKNTPTKLTYYFDFHVDRDSNPGKYEAELEIKLGKVVVTQAISLWIHELVLPLQFDLEASFGFAPWEVLLKTFGKWNSKDMALYREYQNLALEHRIDLHKLYVKFPEADAEDLLQDGPLADQTFMGQMTNLFQGKGTPYGHQQKMTDLPVPEKFKNPPTDKVKESQIEAFWKKLNASVLKQGLIDKTFVYFVDEPKPDQFKGLGDRMRKIRKWAPDLRFLVTTHHRPSMDGTFNIWGINLFMWDKLGEPTPEFYKKRQSEKNEKLWFYVGCNSHGCDGPEDINNSDLVIDRPSAYQRSFPWIALRYGAEGILYFDTVYGYSHGGEASPWKDGFSFTGYGEGNLFYPCTLHLGGCKEPKIFPSFRLKVIRDGLEDVQIMKMAKEKKLPVDQWVAAMIPSQKAFPKDNASYEELKRKALRAMDSNAKK